MTNDELIARAEEALRMGWGHNLPEHLTTLVAALKASEARAEELEEALVKSRRIMASRQPDKMPDGVHICDTALKGGTQ